MFGFEILQQRDGTWWVVAVRNNAITRVLRRPRT